MALNFKDYDIVIDWQYSPSQWCVNKHYKRVVEEHLTILATRSLNNSKTLVHEYFPYKSENPTSENRYVLYKTAINSKKLIIFIHGGFWQMLDLESSGFLADFAVSNGINYAAVGYNLSPVVSLETIVKEVQMGIKHLLSSNPDLDEVYILGHSAGAHLALMCLVYDGFANSLAFSEKEKTRINGVILISGIYDVRPTCYTRNNENLQLTDEAAWNLSPLRCIERLSVCNPLLKAFVIVAEQDSPAFKKQTVDICDPMRLHVTKDRFWYKVVKDRNHFDVLHDIGQVDYGLTDDLLAFIKL